VHSKEGGRTAAGTTKSDEKPPNRADYRGGHRMATSAVIAGGKGGRSFLNTIDQELSKEGGVLFESELKRKLRPTFRL